MRVSSYAVARPAYYDRNAASVIATDQAIYAPHSGTVRSTTTVAAGKKMFIETSSTSLQNITAPTVAGVATSIVRVNATALLYTDPVRTDTLTSGVLTTLYANSITGQTTLYASEFVYLITANTSTGGTVNHLCAFKATLFDA